MNRPFWSRRRPASSDFETETCDGIEPLLSLYADGMAAPEESRRAAAHLATCADCRESLAWMQATHRALASRPIVAPPANLQARIAEAIAASSAAPVRLSPVRAFHLRPSYGAAASLVVLGIVLGVSLLHHPALSPTLAVHPVAPPRVAVIPKSNPITPARQSHPLVAQVKSRPHATIHPTVRREERVATTAVPSIENSPEPYRENPIVLTVKRLPVRAVKKTALPVSPRPVLLAQRNPAIVEHQHPPVMPIPSPPSQVASVPKTPPSVPVNIGPSTVTTQQATPHIQLASDILGEVRARAILMRNAGFAQTLRSVNHAALNVHGFDTGETAVYPITYGPLTNR